MEKLMTNNRQSIGNFNTGEIKEKNVSLVK